MSDQKRYYKNWPEGVPKEVEIPNISLVDSLESSVKKYPNNVATDFMGFELTYSKLLNIVYRAATKLHELGIRKGDCIAIQYTNNPAFIAYFYATLKLGGVVTSISPLFKSLEIKRQLNDSEAKIYLGWEGFSGMVDPIIEETGVKHKFYTNLSPFLSPDPMAPPQFEMGGEPTFEDIIRETEANPPEVKVDTNDLAMLQYTGGTTGFPKGAMLTHRNIISNCVQVDAWFVGTQEGNEVLLGALPFYHIYLVTGMNIAIYKGWKIACVFNPREAHEVVEVIERTKASIFPGIAALFNNLNNYEHIKEHDLSSIKYCLSGAAPLPEDVRIKFEEISGAKVREAYGLTEMSPATTANPFVGKTKPGTVGIPFPSTEVKICNPDGSVLDIGEVGELVVRGPQMMIGYYKREGETKNTIKEGWLWTGDLAVMDEDGYISIKARQKNLIKYKGHSVYPAEVEDLLYNYEAIQECGIIGILDNEGEENIKAFITLKNEYKGKVTEQDIIDWAKKNMGFEKYPRFVEFIDEVPKTTVGKVYHLELRKLEEEKKKK
ncbi:MAG: AMP-binding protein [Candidatus Heimdallarchaeota archaeon]